MTANPQRVDVERLSEIAHWLRRFSDDGQHKRIPGPSSGAAYEAGVEIDGIAAALLQQLAEREAEITRLNRLADAISRDCNDCANQRNEAMAKAVAAERAWEEACGLLREVISDYGSRYFLGDDLDDRIAAYLAANGSQDDNS